MTNRLYTTSSRPMEEPAPLERTQPLKLIWHSLAGGLGLFAVMVIATGAFVAMGLGS